MASGSVTESLILAKAAAQGIKYQPGWILGTAATVKVFIDIFIGIWAFVLAWIWTKHFEVRKGDTAKVSEIWKRFPKFIIGYVVTFLFILLVALTVSPPVVAKVKAAMGEAMQAVVFFRADVLHRRLTAPGILGKHRPVGRVSSGRSPISPASLISAGVKPLTKGEYQKTRP